MSVPFGEVGTVENLTRDYSYAVIDAGIGYGEDTDRVSDVLREIAAGMESDEDWRDRIIPPFEVFGVRSSATRPSSSVAGSRRHPCGNGRSRASSAAG